MSAEALALRIADRNPQGFEVMLAREELQSRFHQHELALEPNVWQEQWMKSTIIITAGTAIIAAIIWSGW
jgi:hypothetical protein